MARKRLAAVLVFAVLIAGGLIVFCLRTSGPTWKLPDGSELSFVRVTSGARQEIVYATRWRDRMYPLLPAKFRPKLHAKVAVHTSLNPDAIVVWFKLKPARTIAGRQELPPYQIVVVDGNGLEAGRLERSDSTFFLPKGVELQAWELREYPRRSLRFGIRIQTGTREAETLTNSQSMTAHSSARSDTSDSIVGEFLIANPIRNSRADWSSDSLPATRLTNGVQISLQGLETGLSRPEPGTPDDPSLPKAFSAATFWILDHGKPNESWRPVIVELSDASGEMRSNIRQWPIPDEPRFRNDGSQRWPPATGRGSLDVRFVFAGALWLEEPAWKLKVKLSRESQFPPEEIWRFGGLRIPAARQVTEVNARTNLFGEEIELLGLSAPHARLPAEWVSTRTNFTLHARTPLPLPGLHFTLVEVRDEQGRVVNISGVVEEPSTGGRGATMRELNRGYSLAIQGDARTLDATFALSRDYLVEFSAKASLAKRKE